MAPAYPSPFAFTPFPLHGLPGFGVPPPVTVPVPVPVPVAAVPVAQAVVKRKATSNDVVSFAAADARFNAAEFTVAATDTKGHSNREYVQMPPSMHAQLETIVQSRIFPYRRVGDVIRHAIQRHFPYLREHAPHMASSYYGALLMETELLRENKFKQETEAIFKTAEEQIEALQNRGDVDEAATLAYKLFNNMEQLPATSWKRRFEHRFNRLYKDLVLQGQALLEGVQEQSAPMEALTLPMPTAVPQLPPPIAAPLLSTVHYPEIAPPLPLPTVPLFIQATYVDDDPGTGTWAIPDDTITSEHLATAVYFGPPEVMTPVAPLPEIAYCVADDYDYCEDSPLVEVV